MPRALLAVRLGIDLKIQKFFDSVPWDRMLKPVAAHTDRPWVLLRAGEDDQPYLARCCRPLLQETDLSVTCAWRWRARVPDFEVESSGMRGSYRVATPSAARTTSSVLVRFPFDDLGLGRQQPHTVEPPTPRLSATIRCSFRSITSWWCSP